MNMFNDAIQNQDARTENGMLARKSTANACTDLFFKIGASRGKDIIPQFVSALVEDEDIALRIAQWARDVRGGAGERQLFIDILEYLDINNPDLAISLIKKVPELGRWKDLIEVDYINESVKNVAYDMIKEALDNDNALCAKWMPRKGDIAHSLRNYFDWTPKFYRKRLVELTKVVETQMCENDWDNIEFGKVPSLAISRYKNAFYQHTDNFETYVDGLTKGTEKVNAGAVYPYDVIKGAFNSYNKKSKTEQDLIIAQWDALENFVGDANILPMIDVSGSMNCTVGGSKSLRVIDVAVSLGLYLADKNEGDFKDTFLTFSNFPELVTVSGNIIQKIQQTITSNWNMNTDLVSAVQRILSVAKDQNVPNSEMPEMLIIFSDMQFDRCVELDQTGMDYIRDQYELSGYTLPKVVFWNLRDYGNVPVKFNDKGVALVSGFSPAILKSLVSGDLEQFTPQTIMMNAIMIDKYNI